MISQKNCTATTPMGATLLSDQGHAGFGATFRAWAPRAKAVYLNGVFGLVSRQGQTPDLLLAKDANGYWSGFVAEAADGDTYHFFVVGEGSSGYKRDPYARELANDPAAPFPVCSGVIREAKAYPWHDAGFRPPAFSDMVIYQLHIGTYLSQQTGTFSTFLDVVEKLEYLVSLGVNVVQPLPVWGNEENDINTGSLGYDGSDYFSPEVDYGVYAPAVLKVHLATVNRLLAAKGFAPLGLADITPAYAQLKVMVDLLHVYGIATLFDVVYNHAGGWSSTYEVPVAVDPSGKLNGDDESLYFWDRASTTGPKGGFDNNQSLYFTDVGYVGGLSFALWNADVRGYLLNNAAFYLGEMHGDGFRYDEISNLLGMNNDSGWLFVRALADAVRKQKPSALQNAEYWPGEYYNQPVSEVVAPTAQGGMGFDALQHDALREAIRTVIGQAAGGAAGPVGMTGIAMALWPAGLAQSWRAIPCVENHDIVKVTKDKRMAALADGSDARSWYARSRSRVASGLLLFAPGIPQLFMGQEFLEDKQWNANPKVEDNLIWWGGLAKGVGGKTFDPAMGDFLHFMQDAVRLRRNHPALRGEGLNVFHTSDADRVIAFQRWVVDEGQDVVVLATLSESTWWRYRIGFPSPGRWAEIFNSDVYDNWVNPMVAGNAGGVEAVAVPMQGMPASAEVVIPANGILVFARA